MARVLKIVGAWMIVLGIVGAIGIMSQVDWDEYRLTSRVLAKLPDNQFSKADYNAARNAVVVGVGLAVGTLLSGVVSGIVFLGMGEGLETLAEIRYDLKEMRTLAQKGERAG